MYSLSPILDELRPTAAADDRPLPLLLTDGPSTSETRLEGGEFPNGCEEQLDADALPTPTPLPDVTTSIPTTPEGCWLLPRREGLGETGVTEVAGGQ